MTESQLPPNPRSAFLPVLFLFVGLVIVAGLTFIPFVQCPDCEGNGYSDWNPDDNPGSTYAPLFHKCPTCGAAPANPGGKVSLLRKLLYKPKAKKPIPLPSR